MSARPNAQKRRHRAVLFDFFGTLVHYEPERGQLSYPETHRLASRLGYKLDHDRFLADWDAASQELEAEAKRTLIEFSMADAGRAFADRAGLPISPADADHLGASFVHEWRHHVRPVDGVADMLRHMALDFRLGVVSNTHDLTMVPSMLTSMGVSDCLATVVLSVEHGRLKPHESIYRRALDDVGILVEDAVFVGDSFEADYTAPTELGMTAFLIDPERLSPVPSPARLDSVLDLSTRV